ERFRGNGWPTLGVEIELQLVDSRSMALRSAIGEILADLPEDLRGSVKPEFMQCYVEINSEVGRTVDDVEADLAEGPGRRGGGPASRPAPLLGGDASVLAVAGPADHTRRALLQARRRAPGDGHP